MHIAHAQLEGLPIFNKFMTTKVFYNMVKYAMIETLTKIDTARKKIKSTIDAYKRKNYGQLLSSLYYAYFHIIKASLYKIAHYNTIAPEI